MPDFQEQLYQFRFLAMVCLSLFSYNDSDPFAPEPPVTAGADPRPFYPL